MYKSKKVLENVDYTLGVWDMDTTNPSTLPLKNSTVILIYRSCGIGCSGSEQIGIPGKTTRQTH